jgi:hypothetical protein
VCINHLLQSHRTFPNSLPSVLDIRTPSTPALPRVPATTRVTSGRMRATSPTVGARTSFPFSAHKQTSRPYAGSAEYLVRGCATALSPAPALEIQASGPSRKSRQ